MKTVLSFLAVSILMTGVAGAAELQPSPQNRIVSYDVVCKFWNDVATTRNWNDPERCFAASKLFFQVNREGATAVVPTDRELMNYYNKLAVLCDNELVYADGAEFFQPRRHTSVIRALGQQTPAIVLKNTDTLLSMPETSSSREFDARLFVRNDRLEGQCRVSINR